MLSFAVFDESGPAKSWPARLAHLQGAGDLPLQGTVTFSNGRLLCEKTTPETAQLVVQVHVDRPSLANSKPPLLTDTGLGVLSLKTCLLPDRDQPYLLNLELARHQIMEFLNKLEDWNLVDLPLDNPVLQEFELARRSFTAALVAQRHEDDTLASNPTTNPASNTPPTAKPHGHWDFSPQADRMARASLAQALDAGEKLAVLAAERQMPQRLSGEVYNKAVATMTSLTGEKVWTLKCPMESGLYNNEAEYHPTNVAIVPTGLPEPWASRTGDIYVADGYGKNWIHHYNAKGEYLRSWGGPGGERGQVSCPHGLMVDTRDPANPMLVVADRSNKRLQFFTLDGRHVKFVKDEMKAPCHFDTRGTTLLVPDLQARVTLLDKDNKLILHMGDGENYNLRDKPRDQFVPGKFIAPHGAIFDRKGNIFVVEWVEVGRVTKLRKV